MQEIENILKETEVFLYLFSEDSIDSQGQDKELEILNKLKKTDYIVPIVLRKKELFKKLPTKMKWVNGEMLDGHNIKSVTRKFLKTYFPGVLDEKQNSNFYFPKPGQWLEVVDLSGVVEEYFNMGDRLFFRRISPLGLFECYAPKVNGLFWIDPASVKLLHLDGEQKKEPKIPRRYEIIGMLEIEQLGVSEYNKKYNQGAWKNEQT